MITLRPYQHLAVTQIRDTYRQGHRSVLFVLPTGAELVALCNWNTISDWRCNPLTTKPGTRVQQQLGYLIESYGSKENLGECFGAAERPTRVSVGMVRLTKPGQRVSGADEFDGFFSVALLKALWGCSQSQVSRRMTAIDDLGLYRIRSGWGRYTLIQPRPEKPAQTTSRERWETVRQQLQEVIA